MLIMSYDDRDGLHGRGTGAHGIIAVAYEADGSVHSVLCDDTGHGEYWIADRLPEPDETDWSLYASAAGITDYDQSAEPFQPYIDGEWIQP